MLIAKIEYHPVFYANLVQKLEFVKRRTTIHVDIFKRKSAIYVVGLDDGFSATFVYMAYYKAREKGLEASLMYARFIDESALPEIVRKLGETWLRKKLRREDVEKLKKMMITEHVFDKWCKVS